MLIRYILKNMRRSVVTNALFCMLLALAGALFALSAGLWYSVYKTEQNLDDIITTIALPDMYAIRRYAKKVFNSGDLSGFTTSWGMPLDEYIEQYAGQQSNEEVLRSMVVPHIQNSVMNQISEKVYGSGLLEMDDRRVYGAYAPDVISVPMGVTESGDTGIFIENYPQFTAAFVVECTGVEEVFSYGWSETNPTLMRAFVADFRVEQDIYVHHGRFQTKTVTGFFPYTNPDGSAPVEEGKRYVVAGYQYSQGGGTQTDNPGWYYALPPNRKMPNALNIESVGENFEIVDTETITQMYQFSENILPYLARYAVYADVLPMTIMNIVPGLDPDLGYEGQTWFELDGSLEDALASEQGDNIRTALSVAEISVNSLMALTTNDINSLQRFNQRTNKITTGRDFSASEIAKGDRVCVISEQLAEINGLSTGDTISLRMYPTALGQISAGDLYAWPPNPYHPKSEISEPIEYKIVGLYSGLTQDMTDYAISPNTVFIPAASFEGFEGSPVRRMYSSYDPPLLNTIIVPNDGIEEGKALIDNAADGYGSFFRFFDQGYATLKPVLANLRFSMTWITAIAAVGWVIAVSMFSVFYIGRKKKEIVLLYGVGVSKGKGFLWAYLQSAVITVVAQCFVLGVSVSFFGSILNAAVSVTQSFTEGYRDFTLSDMNITGGIRLALPLETAPTGVILATAGTAALLLGTAAYFSIRAARRSSLMTRGEG